MCAWTNISYIHKFILHTLLQLLYCKLFIAFLSKCWGHPGSEQRRKPSWESSTQPPGWILRVQEELNLTKACDLLFSYHVSDPFRRKHSVSQSQFLFEGHAWDFNRHELFWVLLSWAFLLIMWVTHPETNIKSIKPKNESWVGTCPNFSKKSPVDSATFECLFGTSTSKKTWKILDLLSRETLEFRRISFFEFEGAWARSADSAALHSDMAVVGWC